MLVLAPILTAIKYFSIKQLADMVTKCQWEEMSVIHVGVLTCGQMLSVRILFFVHLVAIAQILFRK
jgi:hypothetical protein